MSGETASGFDVETEPKAVVTSVVVAALLGGYASWIAADLLPRWLVFGFVLVVGSYGLLTQDLRQARLQSALYTFAGLLFLTPILLVLPDVLHADTLGVSASSLAFTTANLLFFVVFAIFAAVFAGLGYWIGERARIDPVE